MSLPREVCSEIPACPLGPSNALHTRLRLSTPSKPGSPYKTRTGSSYPVSPEVSTDISRPLVSNAESEALPPHSQLLRLAWSITLDNERNPHRTGWGEGGDRGVVVGPVETCESSRHPARAQHMHLGSPPVSHAASLLANHPGTTLGARQRGGRGSGSQNR